MITYLFRAFPSSRQEKISNDTLETCRRLYNDAVADRIKNHSKFYDQEKAMVQRKKENKHLKAVRSQVLLDALLVGLSQGSETTDAPKYPDAEKDTSHESECPH